jgi:BlaI family penicillinase repressor
MKLTEPEWIIMNALWEKHPARARDIFERLPATVNWAYTTVKTMLDRLVEKKAVSKSKRANAGLYKPLLSRRQARRTALRTVLDRAFDGAFGPMMSFLVEDENLSVSERRELIEILSGKSRNKENKNV